MFSGAGNKAFVSGAAISQFEDVRVAKAAMKHYASLAEDALPSLLAGRITAIDNNAALTLLAAQTIIDDILKPSPDLDADRCRELSLRCFQNDDCSEGCCDFLEKRKPPFKGR